MSLSKGSAMAHQGEERPFPEISLTPKEDGVQNTCHSSLALPSSNPWDTYRREGHCSCDITTPPRPPQPLRVTPRPLWVGWGGY